MLGALLIFFTAFIAFLNSVSRAASAVGSMIVTLCAAFVGDGNGTDSFIG
jgi:hypothetical protein